MDGVAGDGQAELFRYRFAPESETGLTSSLDRHQHTDCVRLSPVFGRETPFR